MNAQLKLIESSPAREVLKASNAHRAGLEAQLEEPRAARARVQLILDEAAATQAAVVAAIGARRDLEVQHLLLGKPTDSSALQAAESEVAKAQKLAAAAERRADAAREAAARIDEVLGRLAEEIQAETNRGPLLRHAVLIEEGMVRLDEFRSMPNFDSDAWEHMAVPFAAADHIALANPHLGIPVRLLGLKGRIAVPMPRNTMPESPDGVEQVAYVDLGRNLEVLAQELLADLAA